MILDVNSEVDSFYYDLVDNGYGGSDAKDIAEDLVDDIDTTVSTALDEFHRINTFTGVDFSEISKQIYSTFDVSGAMFAASSPFPMIKQIKEEASIEVGIPGTDKDEIPVEDDIEKPEDLDNINRQLSIFTAMASMEKRTKIRQQNRKSLIMERIGKVKEGIKQMSTRIGKEFDNASNVNRIVSELRDFLSSELADIFMIYEDAYLE